ncbi:MAG: hypothetical protein AAFW46_00960 [Pseudomonadota bacterium]
MSSAGPDSDPPAPLPPDAPAPLRLLWARWRAVAVYHPPTLDDFPFDSLVVESPGLAVLKRETGSRGRVDYRFVAVGPDHLRNTGVDLPQRPLSDLVHPRLLPQVMEAYARIFEQGEPHYWEFANAVYGAPHVSYQRLLAPLFEPDGTVTHAIGSWCWRDD